MNKTKQPGISFEKIVFEKVNLKVNPEISFEDEELSLGQNFQVDRIFDSSKRNLKLTLKIIVSFGVKSPPMDISATATGYFSIDKATPVENLEKYGDVQAASLLMPFIREMIANLTSRTIYPPILIPPINMIAAMAKGKTRTKIKKTKKAVKTAK